MPEQATQEHANLGRDRTCAPLVARAKAWGLCCPLLRHGDLQASKLLESRKRLGKGELSSIAFAMKIGQAVITDDLKARTLAKDSGHPHVQTTPHLFSWLIFKGRLGDFDKGTVIAQHKAMDRPLAPHFETAYEMALQCRLNVLPSSPSPSTDLGSGSGNPTQTAQPTADTEGSLPARGALSEGIPGV